MPDRFRAHRTQLGLECGPMSRRGKKKRAQAAPQSPASQAATPVAARPAWQATWFHLLLLAAVTLALYAGALRNGFVADDQLQILRNRWIVDFRSLAEVFANSVWAFDEKVVSNYYRPLHMVVYMAEYSLFGAHPAAWHAANLAFHLGALFAAYFLVRALAGASLAFWATLFFALHPVLPPRPLGRESAPVSWVGRPGLLCRLAV